MQQTVQRLLSGSHGARPNAAGERDAWASVAVAVWRRQQQLTTTDDDGDTRFFVAQNAVLTSLTRAAATCNKWIIPALTRLCTDLRLLSHHHHHHHHHHQQEAVRSIHRAFTVCLNDRNPVLAASRKWGVYNLVNTLLRTYFGLGNAALAKSTVAVLTAQKQQGSLPPLEKFDAKDQAAFWYFAGVLAFRDHEYARAVSLLKRAFDLIPQKHSGHRQAVLVYLIPAQILIPRGQGPRVTPNAAALDRGFPLLAAVYNPLVHALLAGNLHGFDTHLVQHQSVLLPSKTRRNGLGGRVGGVYEGWRRVRVLVHARLVRRVWQIQDRSSRLSLCDISTALRLSLGLHVSEDKDKDRWRYGSDRVECCLTLMISEGEVKGYVSRGHQMLVLSKKEAFPRAQAVVEVA